MKLPLELIEDVSPQAMQGIENILAAAIALEIDRVGLNGSGSGNEPQGLAQALSVTNTAATPADWSGLLSSIFAVKGRNANPTAAILSVRDEQTLAGLTASDGQPLQAPQAVADLPRYSSTSVPSTSASAPTRA